MTLEAIQQFVSTLQEPAVVATIDGAFKLVNDAFRNTLRQHNLSDARTLYDIVADEDDVVADFLWSCARTRPAIQGSLTLADGAGIDRFSCYGGLLRAADEKHEPLILLRFYRAQESVRRFQLLGRKIDELNSEVRRRRGVEDELRRIQETLKQHVAERTADLERANRELIRSNRSLEEFAHVASHDLREPLRKITVFSEMLREEAASELSEESRSILQRISNAAHRMDRLIQSLLEYSRVSTTIHPVSRVDLNGVVAEVIADLEILVSQTGAHIDVGTLPEVKADEMQMRQLFQNLISNSLKFRNPDATPIVRITAPSDNGDESRHVIEVTDNGIGFEAEFADQIFDPFRRLNPRHLFEGAGIGLAVCRRIVERHGGRITASGEPGKGATFRIILPEDGQPAG